MELELRHLRTLCAIADAGSVGRAAAVLGYSQPAMSTQLRRIERLFGEPIELAPQAVEFAGRRHESRPNTERQRREPSRDQFVRILPERDLVRS